MDDSWMLPCISKKISGMDCPGCGIQRSISLLLEGDLSGSFFMYPGLIPIAILFLFLGVDLFIKIKSSEKIKIVLTVFALGTIMTNYIIKMVSIF